MKIKRTISALAISCLLLSLPTALFASSAGTREDPLVSYSFITGQYRDELKRELYDELLAELKASGISQSTESAPAAQSGYEVLHLTAGQTLWAEDVCELILRAGSAAAVVSLPANVEAGVGLSDCTAGAEICSGEAIAANHLLLIPRADGRGLTVLSADAYVMVRGAHTIQE